MIHYKNLTTSLYYATSHSMTWQHNTKPWLQQTVLCYISLYNMTIHYNTLHNLDYMILHLLPFHDTIPHYTMPYLHALQLTWETYWCLRLLPTWQRWPACRLPHAAQCHGMPSGTCHDTPSIHCTPWSGTDLHSQAVPSSAPAALRCSHPLSPYSAGTYASFTLKS